MIENEFLASLRNVSSVIPELPEDDASVTLDIIEAYERSLILPFGEPSRGIVRADYGDGSATYDDEVAIFGEQKYGILVNADHATSPIRVATGVREGPDSGTGAIARLLAEEEEATALIPVGRQTGNASVDADYPIKHRMTELLPDRRGFLSIHGMIPGKVLTESDDIEVHALLGLGKDPTEKTRDIAEKLVSVATDLGIRTVISNDHSHMIRNPNDATLRRNDDGTPFTKKLAALKENTTTNHARRTFAANGKDSPSFQIELTRGLRLIPEDFEGGWYVDRKARAMGVYAGYLLCRTALQLQLGD